MPAPAGPAARVVHAVPGRLRLHVPALRARPDLADRVLAAGLRHPGVRGVRVNLACASVLVEYDRGQPLTSAGDELVGRWLEESNAVRPPAAAAPRSPVWRRLAPIGLPLIGLGLGVLGAGPLAIAATALGAAPIVHRSIHGLVRERRPTVDHLDATAVGMMLALGDIPGAAIMCALVAVGEEIRERTARRSRRAALDLRAALGQSAWVVRGKKKLRVSLEQLAPDDVIVAYAGDLIPVDGIVLDGAASVDQKTLTGESRPILREPGDRVLAATVIADGKLYVRAEAVGESTRAGQIARALQDAPVHDTRAGNYAYQFANRLVGPTFLLAGGVYLLTGNLARAAAIVIIDFATGIRVSAPTAVLATLTRAARDGILLKDGRALEQLAKADVVIFDKTGTLTLGEPAVSDVVNLNGLAADDVLGLAAAAEIRLRHPAARALVRHARLRDVAIPERESSSYTTGQGVCAAVGGRTVRVGSARFLQAAGISADDAVRVGARFNRAGSSVAYVALEDNLVGVVAYHDPARPEAASVVSWLRSNGVKDVLMVTGDEPAAAMAVARPMGISRVHAGALPQDKADIVQDLQRQGHVVAVVGDGINDSPALALADVSVSLPHGADLAREAADVVLMEPDLRRLPHAIELSRQCMRLIEQNFAIIGMPNAGAMALATAGLLNPIGATVISNGSTMLAAMNSLRPLADRKPGPASEEPLA